MIQEYCQNCKKVTGHKRVIGMGTFLGACVTLGTSLAAVPFYPKRCVVCGCKTVPTPWVSPTSKSTGGNK